MTDTARSDDPDKAAAAPHAHLYCEMRGAKPVVLPADIAPDRASAIVVLASKWADGTQLRYYFFTDRERDGEVVTFTNGRREFRTWVGAEAQRDVVRDAFAQWKDLGIGLDFIETDQRSEAEIRIGFMVGDGAWSYVGTDILEAGPNERTMNFGWDLVRDPDTALHEIGHTLGLPHEHQNPNAGIVWNEPAVYASLAAPPNSWDHDKTFHNIIRKIPPDTVQGSSWDPDSIMHYPFEAGLIAKPEEFAGGLQPAGGLSPRDVTWITTFYPPIDPGSEVPLEPAVSQPLDVAVGQQANFVFEPQATRKHKVQTFGSCDTQIVLFEEVDGLWRYLSADDDSGENRNALIEVRLRAGRRYAVRVRLKFSGGIDPPAVMLW